MTSIIEDLGDLCLECRKDTSFGSGKFINRIPCSRSDGYVSYDDGLRKKKSLQKHSDYKTEEGYLCDDCLTLLIHAEAERVEKENENDISGK